MARPIFSVVVSNFNYGRYLAEAIDSALRQTYVPTEVVVVDDGSTDGSQEIIRSYGGAVHAVCRPNRGQAAAWNVGADLARGAWVVFLDSDDRLTEEAGNTIVNAGAASPPPSKIHWPMRLIDDRGEQLGIQIPDGPLPHGDRLPELIEFGFDRGPNLASSGNAWNADFLRRVLPLPEVPFWISADTFLLGLSPLFGSTAAIDVVCSEYRCHSDNNGARGSARACAADIISRSSVVFDRVGQELARRGIHIDPGRWERTNPTFVRNRRRLANGLDDA